MQTEALADAVREQFSGAGLEVRSTGAASLTVALPVEATDIDQFFELANDFGAAVDFKSTQDGPVLVAFPDPAAVKQEPERRSTCGAVVGVLFGALSVAIIALLAWPRLQDEPTPGN